MDEANGTSEAPFATVQREGQQITPLWEVIEDLAKRCEAQPAVQELLLRAADLAKGTL